MSLASEVRLRKLTETSNASLFLLAVGGDGKGGREGGRGYTFQLLEIWSIQHLDSSEFQNVTFHIFKIYIEGKGGEEEDKCTFQPLDI